MREIEVGKEQCRFGVVGTVEGAVGWVEVAGRSLPLPLSLRDSEL